MISGPDEDGPQITTVAGVLISIATDSSVIIQSYAAAVQKITSTQTDGQLTMLDRQHS